MSALPQHHLTINPLTAAAAIAPAPMLFPLSQGSAIVPGGPASACTPVVVAARPGEFIEFPPPHNKDDDEKLLYTYQSVQEDPFTTLPVNTHHGIWSFAVRVPIPSIDDPTLLELSYMVKYATTGDHGNSTVQTDVILSTESLPEGVVTQTTDLDVYRNHAGYGPRMVDSEKSLRLSTILGVKSNGGSYDHWSHFIDNQHINPKVRIIDEAYLYLIFHVCEYPTINTVRSLYVEVSATWQKEAVNRKAEEEAERKAKEEEEIRAKKEAEKKARWQEEKQARIEAKAWMENEKRARDEERAWREETRVALKELNNKPSVANAPDVADTGMQDMIANKMKELNLQPCDSGYAFKKTSWGYVCDGGSHKITFEQLGLK